MRNPRGYREIAQLYVGQNRRCRLPAGLREADSRWHRGDERASLVGARADALS